MLLTRRKALGAVATASLWARTWPAGAQAAYPNQPVRLVVPYPPGGGTDYFARQVTPGMGAELGQSIYIENRAGASGIIGATAVAHSFPADGYTFLLGDMTTFAVNPIMFDKLQYDVNKDLTPITMTATFDFVLVVNPQVLPVHNVQELVATAAKAPTGLNYASPSIGTTHHLAMEMFARQTGAKLVPITYKGGGPAIQDLLAGQVGVMFLDRASARQHLESGKLRAIAAAGSQRIASLPDLPTVAEAGVKGFAVEGWQGFMARRGTPAAVIAALNAAYRKAIQAPDLRKRLDEAGVNPVSSTPAEFGQFVSSETDKWRALITERGIKAE